MATFATQDDLNALTQLIRTLQDDIATLDASVGEIDTLIEKINHVEALKDITLTYVTEGDVLQFSSDGTWHNVQPAALNMGIGDGEGSPVDSAIVKSLIQSEGAKLFISKLYDDTASGQITFRNGLVSQDTAYFKEGLEIGDYVPGFLGAGAKIDKNGYAEMSGLTLREFLEVPELRFNRIDVVSGELWNSIAFGTIESVNTRDQVVTLKLEDGEYSGLKVGDICRGIFHNIDGYNNTETGLDDCNFDRIQGFSTSYFTPTEIIGERGEKFRYALRSDTTPHPCPAMKFAVYGSFTNADRRNSAYHTRTYTRYLKDVATWKINQTLNVASQFGTLDGLEILGAPNNGKLTGNGAYLSNVYMTNALVQFEPEQEAMLKGKDGYSVTLDHYSASILVDNENNIIDLEGQSRELTFYLQVFKGPVELVYDNVYGQGKYFVEYNPIGCDVTFNNGTFRITNITGTRDCYISIIVNCEGETLIKQTFTVVPLLEPNSQWTTYHDNDALPPIPTGDGTLDGWHRNYTSTAIWMSSKNTRDVWEGEWGDPVRFVGASVAGEDGQYTAFAYTISSETPPIPTKMSGLPPKDPSDLYTWHMFPPERPNLNVFTFMSQCTVYGDKTQSGWSTPIRMTGDDGVDGTDGADLEFIYGLFTPTDELERPFIPVSENVDDFVPDMNTAGLDGVDWDDNPHGVSEEKQYEWVCQRTKAAGKQGTTVWGEWTVPVIWSKWGEKGMDGDGYEYIYARTEDIDVIPDTPESAQQDEYLPYIKINGVSTGYKWTDDPKGIVSEEYKAEWVCMRKKTDMVWSNFSRPALWSNWGEQGMQGAHYIYRWCVSKSTPQFSANSDNPGSGWVNNSELKAEDSYFVWQIQRLCNPDGTLAGSWGNLIRLTGENGKDGEDGNSIEFLYARNNTGIPPSPPPTNQTTDWTGTSTDTNNGNVTIKWEDNPQGVTANIMYEYVCQRYKDRTTQQWGAYSTPGIWARYAEKGKDGDGFEYIFRRFSSYQSQNPVSPGGAYYPSTSSYTDSSGKTHQYQEDDFVPPDYTDNPVGPTEDVPYEYVWTRKKKQGIWGNWSDGAMWARWSKDGENGGKGDKGDKGDTGNTGPAGKPGVSYSISPGSLGLIENNSGGLDPGSVTFKCFKTTTASDGSVTTDATAVYWDVFGSNDSNVGPGNGTELKYSTPASSFTINFSQYAIYDYYWIGVNPSAYPDSSGDPSVASLMIKTTRYSDIQADSSYTVLRYRGAYTSKNWPSNETFYYTNASTAGDSNYQGTAIIRDYVQYEGKVYLVKNYSSTGISGQSKPYGSSSWQESNKTEIITVNNLLAGNAKLGDFNFSTTKFWSGNGTTAESASLSMDSYTGEFKCTKATITGTINATSGTIGGFTLGSTSLTSTGTYPMTIWSTSGGQVSSAGIQWKNNNVFMTMDVYNAMPRIKMQDSQLDTSNISPAIIMLTGDASLTLDAQTGVGNSQIRLSRTVGNQNYYLNIGISSDGFLYFNSNCFKDDNGSRKGGFMKASISSSQYLHFRSSW